MSIREAILALLFAAVTSVISSSAQAQQWNGPRHGGGGSAITPISNPAVGGQDQAQAYLNTMIQNQNIDLSQLLNLTQTWRLGEVIDSVQVLTAATQASYGARLTLYANGLAVARAIGGSSVLTLFPNQMVQLNGTYGQIVLQVEGSVFITQIVMNLHRANNYPQPPMPPAPPPQQPMPPPQQPPGQGQVVLTANLTNVGSSSRLELVSLLNLNAYRGYRLQSLIIQGRSVVAPGIATLQINDVQAGQVSFDRMDQSQAIPLRGAWIAGVNALQMYLDLQGVQARQVQLVLSR